MSCHDDIRVSHLGVWHCKSPQICIFNQRAYLQIVLFENIHIIYIYTLAFICFHKYSVFKCGLEKAWKFSLSYFDLIFSYTLSLYERASLSFFSAFAQMFSS